MAKLPERCPTDASIPRLTQGRNYLAFFLPSSLRFRVEERGGCLTRLELEDSAPSARPLWFTLQLGWMESDCACWSSLWTGLLCFCIFSRFSSLGVSWYGIILVSHSDLNFERRFHSSINSSTSNYFNWIFILYYLLLVNFCSFQCYEQGWLFRQLIV